MTAPALEDRLKAVIYGFRLSQCVYVAATLGIADCLKDGPKTCAELAELTCSQPAALRRLLRARTAADIFREDEDGRFTLTPIAELLLTDADESLRAEILHVLHPSSWGPWGELLHSIKTGEAAFPAVFGTDVWEYRTRNPETGTLFDAMATAQSQREADAVLRHLDLSHARQLVDVGGGKGGLLAEILSRNTNLHGVLFDLPHVVAGAEEFLREAGVAGRCRVEAGNFFEAIPKDGDVYLLKAVIHNWNNQAAIAILRNCRQAMSPHARIVLVESVLDPERPAAGNLMDLHMLVIHGGQERTAVEFETLFKASGFRLKSVAAASAGISLIEAAPT